MADYSSGFSNSGHRRAGREELYSTTDSVETGWVLSKLLCCSSVIESCLTLCNPMSWLQHARLLCPSFITSLSLFKLMSIESVMPSNRLIFCRPLLLLPSVFPSIRVFSNESVLCIRWPKDWSFSFSISPSNEHSGLISFRSDWFDLLAVQRTLKSLQYHSSKASVLRHSAFSMVQLSHPYMTTGKTRALSIVWTFVSKVMSLLFNTLSRFVIFFLGARVF